LYNKSFRTKKHCHYLHTIEYYNKHSIKLIGAPKLDLKILDTINLIYDKLKYCSEIVVFTDGSTIKGNNISGIGIFIPIIDLNISIAIETYGNNFMAELIAITICAAAISYTNITKAWIFTDSLSTIQSLGKNNSTRKWCRTPLRGWVKLLDKCVDNKKIHLEYIKAHTGKKDDVSVGNEKADKLAKDAINNKLEPIIIGTPDINIYMYSSNQVMYNDIKENVKKFNQIINKKDMKKLKQQSNVLLKLNHSEKIHKTVKNYAITNHDETIYSFWILGCLKWLVNPPFKLCVFCKLKHFSTNHLLDCSGFNDELNDLNKNIKNYLVLKLKNKKINQNKLVII